jgi:hypothetical protein
VPVAVHTDNFWRLAGRHLLFSGVSAPSGVSATSDHVPLLVALSVRALVGPVATYTSSWQTHALAENGLLHFANATNARYACPVDLAPEHSSWPLHSATARDQPLSAAYHGTSMQLTRRLWCPPDHPSFPHFRCAHTSLSSAFRSIRPCLVHTTTRSTLHPSITLSHPPSPRSRLILPPSLYPWCRRFK